MEAQAGGGAATDPVPTCTNDASNSLEGHSSTTTLSNGGTFFSDRTYTFNNKVPAEITGLTLYQFPVCASSCAAVTISINTYPTEVFVLYDQGQPDDPAVLQVFTDAGFTLVQPNPIMYVNGNMEIRYYKKTVTGPTTYHVPSSSTRLYIGFALKPCTGSSP